MPEPAPYWKKNPDLKKIKEDLAWNFPEQKQGTLGIIGGNASSFSTEVRIAEFINKTFPFLKDVRNLFPDTLKKKFPPLPNLNFFKSTDSGSFAKSEELKHALENFDYGLILGDLSKNSVTTVAISEMIKASPELPILITRDAVDLICSEAETIVNRGDLYIVASLASIQKLFRAVYYPRPILLSSPIFPIVETLHKFTLSYPVSILTFHEGKIICADSGDIVTVDLEKTSFSPITLWSGELAAEIAIYNMFNKSKKLDSMLASML